MFSWPYMLHSGHEHHITLNSFSWPHTLHSGHEHHITLNSFSWPHTLHSGHEHHITLNSFSWSHTLHSGHEHHITLNSFSWPHTLHSGHEHHITLNSLVKLYAIQLPACLYMLFTENYTCFLPKTIHAFYQKQQKEQIIHLTYTRNKLFFVWAECKTNLNS